MRSTIILWEFDLNLPSEYLEAEMREQKQSIIIIINIIGIKAHNIVNVHMVCEKETPTVRYLCHVPCPPKEIVYRIN